MFVPYPTKTFLSTYLSIYLLNFPRMMTPGSPFILCVLASRRLPTFQCLVYSSAGHGFSHSHLVVFKCGDGFWAYSHRVPDLVDENKNPRLSNPSTNNRTQAFWFLAAQWREIAPSCLLCLCPSSSYMSIRPHFSLPCSKENSPNPTNFPLGKLFQSWQKCCQSPLQCNDIILI